MQRLAVQRPMVAEAEEQILSFALQGALPQGQTLVLHTRLGTLSHLSTDGTCPCMLAQEQFSQSEIHLLRPLLERYPTYCPHNIMLASFYHGFVNEVAIERARKRLQEAIEYGTWDQEMRPLRNTLSRMRLKLRAFGLEVSSLLATGYLLMFLPGEHADPSVPAGVTT